MLIAVWPVTQAPVRAELPRSRIACTRSSVAVDDGPLDGVTESSARSGPG